MKKEPQIKFIVDELIIQGNLDEISQVYIEDYIAHSEEKNYHRHKFLMQWTKQIHAEIEIEGSLLMMAEENPEWGTKSPITIGGNPITIGLYVPDVDKSFKKAIDAGADMIVLDEIQGQFRVVHAPDAVT